MPEVDRKVGNLPFKQFLERQRGLLNDTKTSFEPQWQEVGRFMSPHRVRLDINDKDRNGANKWNAIINNAATMSLRVAVAGMFAGNMSPARQWFALVHPNDELMDREDVKVWLHEVEQKILTVFRESNFYNVAPKVLKDLLMFGTSLMTHVDDPTTVARFYSHPIGTYSLGLDDKLNVVHMVRELTLYADQVVAKFGLDNVSPAVKTAHQTKDYKHEVYLVHQILPNPMVQPDNPFALGKPYLGVYYEGGPLRTSRARGDYLSGQGVHNGNMFLAVEGFRERPFYAPRWSVEGEDTYATEWPANIALGDVKQLQSQEKRKGQAIDKQTNPPLQVPPTVRNAEGGVNALPGGITFVETGGVDSGRGITTLYNVDLNLQDLRADMEAVEQRIKDAFFVPLFLAITEMEGIQPRNEFELINRNDEALLQLGPVLQQVQGELLSPVVDRVFNQLVRLDDNFSNGILPPPPKVLRDQQLGVRYISSLAQAQRAVATQSIDRVWNFASRIAQVKPDVIDKLNADWSVEEYARVTGVNPQALVDDDQVDEIREVRARAQAAEAQAEVDRNEAQAANQLASAANAG